MRMPSSITAGVLAVASLSAVGRVYAAGDQVFLFPFFKPTDDSHIYLAYSHDGRTFNVANQGNAIFSDPSSFGSQNLTRDASVTYRNGTFYMTWTTGWSGNSFGTATSTDMKTWSNVQQVSPFASGQEQPNNVWAPEVFYDPFAANYKIAFASTLPSVLAAAQNNGTNIGNYANHLYYTTTTDFKTFTAAGSFFDPTKRISANTGDCIDGMVAFDSTSNRWVMAVKSNDAGETNRVIRLTYASAGAITGDVWGNTSSGVAGQGTSLNGGRDAEAPTLLKNGNEWLMYWDAYNSGDWGMASSTNDMTSWTDQTNSFHLYDADGSEITHPQHGTIFTAPASAVGFSEVPEPTALAGLLLGASALLARHRR